jgi:hypothetical protein
MDASSPYDRSLGDHSILILRDIQGFHWFLIDLMFIGSIGPIETIVMSP